LTKAVARHGLGLYIYAGEDIPDPYDDELRAMVNAAAPAPSLSAPKSNKEMMHQNHPKWQAPRKPSMLLFAVSVGTFQPQGGIIHKFTTGSILRRQESIELVSSTDTAFVEFHKTEIEFMRFPVFRMAVNLVRGQRHNLVTAIKGNIDRNLILAT
jgi:hypothetical protein